MFGLSQKEKHRSFYYAISDNDSAEFHRLLKSGVDPNAIVHDVTFMQHAVWFDNINFLEAMMAAGGRLYGPQGHMKEALLFNAKSKKMVDFLIQNK